MAKCDVCGNDYDKSFELTAGGKRYTFDSFECAIHKCAPEWLALLEIPHVQVDPAGFRVRLGRGAVERHGRAVGREGRDADARAAREDERAAVLAQHRHADRHDLADDLRMRAEVLLDFP